MAENDELDCFQTLHMLCKEGIEVTIIECVAMISLIAVSQSERLEHDRIPAGQAVTVNIDGLVRTVDILTVQIKSRKCEKPKSRPASA